MKNKLFLILVIIIILGVVFFLVRFLLGRGKNAQAILKITSEPQTSIFLDNENIGKTPYEDKVKSGEYTIKLIPESTVENVISWEGKVKLNPNLLTFINRDLKDSEVNSGGEILTLEKITENGAEISVVSTPDGAIVTVSGEEKGTTPLLIKDLKPDSYELSVTNTGFKSRSVKIKTTSGYRLSAVFNLAASGEVIASPSPTPSSVLSAENKASATPKASIKPSPTASAKSSPSGSPKSSPKAKTSPPPKPYIEIEETPTGFLRVRKEADGEEVGRVNPGEFYALLDEDTVAGGTSWYKIEYETDKEGWVSSQYAKKFE